MIKLENISKIYGEGEGSVQALEDINLEISSGKFISIVGQSGCGKSTLLNMLGALDTPTTGKVIVDGICLSDLTTNELSDYRNKNLGFIFQAFYLEPYYTVLENVEMPLVISGVAKNERRELAKKIIIKLGLEEKINKRVSELSGGQKQRVSIARAIVHSPRLILADEPTGNLDKKNGEEVIEILQSICAEGKTVILVTHNMEDAKKTDSIIKLTDGKIEKTINLREGNDEEI